MKRTTVTLTLGQATSMLAILQRITQAAVPAKVAFAVARNMAALTQNPDVAAADQTRVKLIREHGEQTATGWQVPPEKLEVYLLEFGEVAAARTEVTLMLLPLEALDAFPPISAADMSVLDPMWDLAEEVSEPKPVEVGV